MDEKTLILNAVKGALKQDPLLQIGSTKPGLDPIQKAVKRKIKEQQFKSKSCLHWSNVDFLHYLDFMLKDFGVRRIKNTRTDSEVLNKLHDRLTLVLKDRTVMSNMILKEYLEWWCSIYATKLSGSETYLKNLLEDQQIKKFSSRFQVSERSSNEEDDALIFSLGGLELLLMKKGINATQKYLDSQGVLNKEFLVKEALGRFSKDTRSQILP
jgi:hypothetical protein